MERVIERRDRLRLRAHKRRSMRNHVSSRIVAISLPIVLFRDRGTMVQIQIHVPLGGGNNAIVPLSPEREAPMRSHARATRPASSARLPRHPRPAIASRRTGRAREIYYDFLAVSKTIALRRICHAIRHSSNVSPRDRPFRNFVDHSNNVATDLTLRFSLSLSLSLSLPWLRICSIHREQVIHVIYVGAIARRERALARCYVT